MTLTQVASLSRKSIIAVIILTILGVAGGVGYQMWHSYYLSTLPPVEEKPEMKFGNLPKPTFPDSQVSSSNFSYSLDTTTGGFPQTPKILKVYFIPKTGITLLAPEKSKKLAQSLGFFSEPQIISPTNYQFSDGNGGSLNIDLTTGNLSYQKQTATGSAMLDTLPEPPQIVLAFKDYLERKNLLNDELKNGRSHIKFSNTSSTNSLIAEVSLWPSDFDELPIITPEFKTGIIRGIITKAEEKDSQFTKLTYIYWPIDKTTFSTYPLKTPEQAFADLRSGKGYISIEPKRPQVSVSSIYLAYYETEEYSPYLQPVFVFEGPEFAALVPAIAE